MKAPLVTTAPAWPAFQSRPFDAAPAQQDVAAQPSHRFGAMSIQRPAPLIVQPKLRIGPADDRYEQEADRVAAQVASVRSAPTPQRQKQPLIQRVATAPTAGLAVLPAVEAGIAAARGGGRPLPADVRPQMEAALGADFSGVRVHTDTRADRLNQAVQARAFTTGRDVFFRHGEYQPGSAAGREVLTHELAHVVQQSGKASQYKKVSPSKQELRSHASSQTWANQGIVVSQLKDASIQRMKPKGSESDRVGQLKEQYLAQHQGRFVDWQNMLSSAKDIYDLEERVNAVAPVAPQQQPVVVGETVGAPQYLYRWTNADGAKSAIKDGILNTGGNYDGIPCLSTSNRGAAANSGALTNYDVLLVIDTTKIPNFRYLTIKSGGGLQQYNILVTIPHAAIKKGGKSR